MQDKMWTHKPGFFTVLDRDGDGFSAFYGVTSKISNPETCNRKISFGFLKGFNYNKFCGYLCVPKGSIDVDVGDPCHKAKDG